MATSKSNTRRLLFFIGIFFKGVDGVMEMIGGAFLFFVSKEAIHRLLVLLVSEELEDDPDNFIANHVMHLGDHLSVSTKTFASLYLVGHGLVKITLVVNLLRNKSWAFPAAIAVLLAFVSYQIVRLTWQFSWGLLCITILDCVVVLFIWLEYRARKKSGSGAQTRNEKYSP